eukprot:1160836-Pelagomonas_calceolata.AAC.11
MDHQDCQEAASQELAEMYTLSVFRHMGFSDVSSTPAAMELQLTAEQLTSGDAIQLKMVKFTFCTNITIFVEDNQTGTETTKVVPPWNEWNQRCWIVLTCQRCQGSNQKGEHIPDLSEMPGV